MQGTFHKRIQKEILLLSKSPLSNLKLDSYSDSELTIEITGAEDTLYANEKYYLHFKLPKTYPIEAPEVIFTGLVPVNEHVYSNGHICLSILYDQWSPALTIESICLSIISMLSSAEMKKKPPNDAGYCKISRNKSPKDFKWSYHN
ncbi:hypothetical protein GVAV_000807 [Gurleya vavrai]